MINLVPVLREGVEDRLADAARDLREPDGWAAGTRGLWRHSVEAFDGLRRFVNLLADSSSLQWATGSSLLCTTGGGVELFATFASGDGVCIMDDSLLISVALTRATDDRAYWPLATVLVDDVAALMGPEPTAQSARAAICDALNNTLALLPTR